MAKERGNAHSDGILIENGYADVIGDPNDIDSLRATVTNFFSEDSSIPEEEPILRIQGSHEVHDDRLWRCSTGQGYRLPLVLR